MRPRSGIALVVTSGILTLLLLAGAGLFAGSARLFEDSYPRSPSLLDVRLARRIGRDQKEVLPSGRRNRLFPVKKHQKDDDKK